VPRRQVSQAAQCSWPSAAQPSSLSKSTNTSNQADSLASMDERILWEYAVVDRQRFGDGRNPQMVGQNHGVVQIAAPEVVPTRQQPGERHELRPSAR